MNKDIKDIARDIMKNCIVLNCTVDKSWEIYNDSHVKSKYTLADVKEFLKNNGVKGLGQISLSCEFIMERIIEGL